MTTATALFVKSTQRLIATLPSAITKIATLLMTDCKHDHRGECRPPSSGGTLLVCKNCGSVVPVREENVDVLVLHAGMMERPQGRYYFTSEICFMCSEAAAIYVPPVTIVYVQSTSKTSVSTAPGKCPGDPDQTGNQPSAS